MAGRIAGDPWKISGEERDKHDKQFFQLNPVAGYITGAQARTFFIQSGLPTPVLGQIWSLADVTGDGKMDKKEFSIAMHLIQKKLHGFELPKILPPSMKVDPMPGVSGVGPPQMNSIVKPPMAPSPNMMAVGTGGIVSMQQQPSLGNIQPFQTGFATSGYSSMPLSNGANLMASPGQAVGFGQAASSSVVSMYGSPVKTAVVQPVSNIQSSADWSVPQSSKLKYTQMFNMHDRMKRGHLTGMEARSILTKSGLLHNILAQVWSLADIDNDGKLTCDEFILAMHLVDLAKSGQILPQKLTPDLIPPSYRKSKPGHAVGLPPGGLAPGIAPLPQPTMPPPKADKFGELLGGFNMISTASPAAQLQPQQLNGTAQNATAESDVFAMQATFEDKRKENFDKGQAELDRRRQLLAEQQEKEKAERLAKEREEFEKREQKRLQQEQKKQQELERQLEKQRQIEMQREEERRKAQEQREAARRELEHQRQLELERRRRDQLMAEKQRMRTEVDEMHGVVSKFKLELEALDSKKADMGTLIEEARNSVTNVTSQIDRMRQSRDMKLHDIEKAQLEYQTWNNKLLLVQQERQQVDIKAQAVSSDVDDAYKTVLHSFNTKKANIEKLKKQLAELEKATEKELKKIDAQNNLKVGESAQFNTDPVWGGKPASNLSDDPFSAFNSEEATSVFSTTATTGSEPFQTTASDNIWETIDNNKANDQFSNTFDFKTTQESSESDKSKNTPSSGNDKKNMWSDNVFSEDLFSNATSNISWGSEDKNTLTAATAWAAFPSSDDTPAPAGSVKSPKPGYRKFKGLYQFDARNPDEVSFVPGDIIWVKPDQSDAEEGWLGGEVNGKEGWFPKAYAEEVQEESQFANAFPPASNAFPSTDAFGVTTSSDTAQSNEANQFNKIDTQPEKAEVQSFETNFDANFASFEHASGDGEDKGASLTASADSSFTAVAGGAPSPTPGQGQKAPEGLQVQSVYTWRAKKDNHLTFEKGDIILVKEQQDMWWSGNLNGKTGWFPKSYVKVIGGSNTPQPTSTMSENEPAQSTVSAELYQNADFASTQQDNSSATNTSEKAVALYTYTSNEPGDLVFNQGEIIIVTKKEEDWWHGELNGRTGMFPANYVKLMSEHMPEISSSNAVSSTRLAASSNVTPSSDQASTPPLAVAAPVQSPVNSDESASPLQATGQNSETRAEADTYEIHSQDKKSNIDTYDICENEDNACTDTYAVGTNLENAYEDDTNIYEPIENIPTSQNKATKKGEIAQVIAPYQATGNEQLSLQPGQLIQVRKKSNSGWWEGELQARGQKRKIGWFPANYVKLLAGSGSARTTPAEKSINLSPSPLPDGGSRSVTPVSLPAPTAAPSLEQVVSLYNYAGQHEDELSFAKGSVINVLNKDDPDWWKGELNGSEGLFPSNYVAPLSEAITEKPASCDGQDVEQKRQKLILELIDSEETYVKDLDILLNVFYKPFKQLSVLTKEELDILFSNLRDIRRCNIKMLNGFRVRKRTCAGEMIYYIGDILCENLPSMAEYIRFCSCQLNAVNLIKTKTDEDPKFVEVHKNCMKDSRTLGLPLSSFLLKPMQRITKYALLIEKIFKYTPEDHADYQNIAEANSKASELCEQVNEGVNEKENSDKLEWIQAHVSCDGLPEKLTFNSLTNSLGPRKYFHSGTLYKAKSGKELVGFLFNDFILLTQPQQSLGNVTSVFSFDIQTDTQFKIYRTPLFLNEIMVKKGAEGENTLFHISHADRMYSLKAVSTSERDFWVKKVEAAAKTYLETERKKREKAHQVRRQPAVGRIFVVMMEGTNLQAGEDGKSDPYCEVTMGAQEHKTKVMMNNLNPKWNQSMQFSIRDPQEDVLCITVYDRDWFTPNDFLGRTEIRIKDIFQHSKEKKGPIIKRLKLYEVSSGEVIVKLDLQLFDKT